MKIQIEPSRLQGTLSVPASKSIAHRMLICAGLAEGVSVVERVSFSKDIEATIHAMEALGASFQIAGSTITVTGIGNHTAVSEASIPCCESGSTLRFLIPVAAALGVSATFFGEGRLPQRPITTYVRELSQKGIHFDYQNTMPFSIDGTLQSGDFYLEGDVSSQYVTGLLFALPLLPGNSRIILLSPLQSKPYVTLTIACMKQFGVMVEETENGYAISGGQHYTSCRTVVEGDYSQAAFFYVANAIGNAVQLENLNPNSVQGDQKIVAITQMLCYNKENGLPVQFDLDATDIPDLVPILAVLGTFGTHPSRITGAHRLKIKESDRLTAISELLNRLGGKVTANEDGLEIEPVPMLHGGTVDSCGDHRIAMCAAIAATRCTHPVIILGGESVEKSYPQFYEDYNALGGNAHVVVLE